MKRLTEDPDMVKAKAKVTQSLPKSMRKQKGASLDMVDRVTYASELISKGKSRGTVISALMEKGVPEAKAGMIYAAATRYMMVEDDNVLREEIVNANIKRLEYIIERSMAKDGNLKLAKETIAELNKMVGIGGNKVAIEKDDTEGKSRITIKFD